MSDPITISNDSLNLAQTNFISDAGGGLTNFGGTIGSSDSNSDFSGGAGRIFDTEGDLAGLQEFEVEYTISESDVDFAIILTSDGSAELELTLIDRDNGSDVGSITIWDGPTTGQLWYNKDGNPDNVLDEPSIDEWNSGDIEPGTYTVEIEYLSGTSQAFVDLISLRDERFTYNFDDTVHEPSGYYDGPELYPDLFELDLNSATTRRDATEADVTSTWSDTSNNQYIAISPDGNTYTQTDNSETASETFSGTREIYVRFGLSRYPISTNPQNETPRFGYNGQSVTDYELFANPSAINAYDTGTANVQAIIPQDTITGETLREAAQLNDSNVALTRSTFAEFTVEAAMSVISSENISFNNP